MIDPLTFLVANFKLNSPKKSLKKVLESYVVL